MKQYQRVASLLFPLSALACSSASSDGVDATAGDTDVAQAGDNGSGEDALDASVAEDAPEAGDTAVDAAAVDDTLDATDLSPREPPLGPADPLEWVDPLIGTGASGFNYGAVPPGAMVPFAMARLSPDTGDEQGSTFGLAHAGGYRYEDPYLLGFSHIHLVGTGIADYGNLLTIPIRGEAAEHVDWTTYRAPLDHSAETARAGYYRIELADRGVIAELTGTARVGMHRYTFTNEGAAAHVLIDVTRAIGEGAVTDSTITVDPANGHFHGFLHNLGEFSSRFGGFTLYFAGRMSHPPTAVATFDGDGFHAGATTAGGTHAGVVLTVDPAAGPVELAVGLSFVDEVGAEQNLAMEAGAFDVVRAAAEATWREKLGVVQVSGGTEGRMKRLYTALYHAALMPTLLMDVDGRYRGIDQQVHAASGFLYYSDLSLWDTYRTFHPLVARLWPEDQRNFLKSLTAMARDWGSLPKWPLAIGEGGSMIGSSADVVFGDAWLMGYDVDLDTIWPIIEATAFGPAPNGKGGRDGMAARYDALGYVPADETNGAVSKTLEYAVEDACDSRLAAAAGDAATASALAARASSWKHLVDGAASLIAPKNADGTVPDYKPNDMSKYYTEGNAWQYTFMVPHDAPGLVAALGDQFLPRLTGLLEGARTDFQVLVPTGYYWHGNEPGLLTTWLFSFAGRPDLTRWWTRWAADNEYDLTPGGLAGNDDGGSLSAWYVFAATGVYPLSCTGTYALSAPLFDRVVWHLDGGDLDVRLGSASAKATWDGEDMGDVTLSDSALRGGGLLVLPAQPESKNPPK